MKLTADIQKIPRKFIPADFTINDWESLEPYLKSLEERPIESAEQLEQWLKDASEIEALISEDACWRQIRMTCDTESKELEQSFNFFMLEIQPKIQPWADRLNKKLLASPFVKELAPKKYFTYLRNVKKSI